MNEINVRAGVTYFSTAVSPCIFLSHANTGPVCDRGVDPIYCVFVL